MGKVEGGGKKEKETLSSRNAGDTNQSSRREKKKKKKTLQLTFGSSPLGSRMFNFISWLVIFFFSFFSYLVVCVCVYIYAFFLFFYSMFLCCFSLTSFLECRESVVRCFVVEIL